MHGQDDDMVPPSQSQILYDALNSAGVPATLIIVPGYGHELPISEYMAAFDFMKQTLDTIPHSPADINCDGTVNSGDLITVINTWGACPPGKTCGGDINSDQVVNVGDMLMVLNDWG
jgi:fermentation-respiration switch protein FrsA (DUF1100 family)